MYKAQSWYGYNERHVLLKMDHNYNSEDSCSLADVKEPLIVSKADM